MEVGGLGGGGDHLLWSYNCQKCWLWYPVAPALSQSLQSFLNDVRSSYLTRKQINKSTDRENNRSIRSSRQLCYVTESKKIKVFGGLPELLRGRRIFIWDLSKVSESKRMVRMKLNWFCVSARAFYGVIACQVLKKKKTRKKIVFLLEHPFKVQKREGPAHRGWTDKCWPSVCLNRCKWSAKRLKFKGGTQYLRNGSLWNSTSSEAVS